jgi:hypothetical protein
MAAPPDLTNFIRGTFRSVWGLELLCHLRRLAPTAVTPQQLVADLRASELVVANGLEALLAAGLVLVETDHSVRYAPANEELDRLAEAADAYYARSPDAVRRMIVASSSAGVSAFADAFRLRRD